MFIAHGWDPIAGNICKSCLFAYSKSASCAYFEADFICASLQTRLPIRPFSLYHEVEQEVEAIRRSGSPPNRPCEAFQSMEDIPFGVREGYRRLCKTKGQECYAAGERGWCGGHCEDGQNAL